MMESHSGESCSKSMKCDEEDSARSKEIQDDLNSIQVEALIDSSIAQRTFSNPLIVRKIVSFLSPPDVLDVRQVSRLFYEEATSLLLSNEKVQQAFHVKFTLAETTLNHEHAFMGTLSDFVKNCWTPSRRFPVLNFAFEKAHFGKKDILEFFIACGKDIRSLSLDPSLNVADCPIAILNFILFEWAPNLKHLSLVSTPWPETVPLFPAIVPLFPPVVPLFKEQESGKKALPLKNLTLHGPGTGSTCSCTVVRDILRSAPDLKRVSDPELKFTQVLIATGKFGLCDVRRFKWGLQTDSIARLVTFAQARPLLIQKMNLGFTTHSYDIWPEIGAALSNLFEGCRTTLKKISKLPNLGALPNLVLPVMENVTEVQFYVSSCLSTANLSAILPPGFTLQQVFPQLKGIGLRTLQNLPTTDSLFENLEGQHHEGVTSLLMDPHPQAAIQPIWVKSTALAFPNITVFEIFINRLDTLPEICRIIWTHMLVLKRLHLNIVYTVDKRGSKLEDEMDSALTGFSTRSCQRLRRNREQVVENVEELRVYPSMLDLKQLKTFTIGWLTPMSEFQPLFTEVALQYAFQPMFERQQLLARIEGLPNLLYVINDGVCGIETSINQSCIL